jgi:hypothetical protein
VHLLAPPGRIGLFQLDLADQGVEDKLKQFLAAGARWAGPASPRPSASA